MRPSPPPRSRRELAAGRGGLAALALATAPLAARARPQGKLPFELPSSMDAVAAQRSDVPHDSRNPLYRFGFGRSYR